MYRTEVRITSRHPGLPRTGLGGPNRAPNRGASKSRQVQWVELRIASTEKALAAEKDSAARLAWQGLLKEQYGLLKELVSKEPAAPGMPDFVLPFCVCVPGPEMCIVRFRFGPRRVWQ